MDPGYVDAAKSAAAGIDSPGYHWYSDASQTNTNAIAALAAALAAILFNNVQ
ncbi:hypothetical protein BVRB_026760 [Beta vulgaris subsp. vulgaris]|uniref:Uncharacterized protein n=1 Tax=Beta vulgaris subsp. vulgaris TaxID=3555 RepID=A0A0J8B1X6_BETVV|nr:hypothetical protein BVRB_026760 [Beta vulgaris subsp. vulgaris]